MRGRSNGARSRDHRIHIATGVAFAVVAYVVAPSLLAVWLSPAIVSLILAARSPPPVPRPASAPGSSAAAS
jgi:membrane glycosyltransferase